MLRSLFVAALSSALFASVSESKANTVYNYSVNGAISVTVDYSTGPYTSTFNYTAAGSGYIQDNGISEYAKAEGDACTQDSPCPGFPSVPSPYLGAAIYAQDGATADAHLQAQYALEVEGPSDVVKVGITSRLSVATTGHTAYASAAINLIQPDDAPYAYLYTLTSQTTDVLNTDAKSTFLQTTSDFAVGDVIDVYIKAEARNYGGFLGTDVATAYVDPYFYIPSDVPNADLYTIVVSPGIGNSPIPATPIPATLPLFSSGLGALGLLGWRKKRKLAAGA
jgi:hypothetical protein